MLEEKRTFVCISTGRGDGVQGQHGADLGHDPFLIRASTEAPSAATSSAGEEGSGGTGLRRLAILPDLPSPYIYYSTIV